MTLWNTRLAAVAVSFLLSVPAFAGWTEILSVDFPANGTFSTTDRLRTSRVKLVKDGVDCERVRLNISFIGRDLFSGLPIYLGMNLLGKNSRGEILYQVVPRATVFDIALSQAAGNGRRECTYTFYAEDLED